MAVASCKGCGRRFTILDILLFFRIVEDPTLTTHADDGSSTMMYVGLFHRRCWDAFTHGLKDENENPARRHPHRYTGGPPCDDSGCPAEACREDPWRRAIDRCEWVGRSATTAYDSAELDLIVRTLRATTCFVIIHGDQEEVRDWAKQTAPGGDA